MSEYIEDRIMGDEELTSEQKLYLVYALYRDEIDKHLPALKYAILKWKDERVADLFKGKFFMDYLREIASL